MSEVGGLRVGALHTDPGGISAPLTWLPSVGEEGIKRVRKLTGGDGSHMVWSVWT